MLKEIPRLAWGRTSFQPLAKMEEHTQICNKNMGLPPVTYVVFWVRLKSLLSDRNSDSRERQHKQLWSQSEGGTTERKVLLHTLHHCKRCIFPYHLEQWYGKISLRRGENPTLKSMPKSKDSFWQFYSCLTTNHAYYILISHRFISTGQEWPGTGPGSARRRLEGMPHVKKKKLKKFCDRPKCDVGTNATQQQGYESFIL